MNDVPFPTPKATLERFGLRPKKSFGQNFLADRSLVERIAGLAGTAAADVVEIGAGLGGLTACLLALGHQVTAIERDRDLVPVLQELFAEQIASGQLTVLEADAKTVDVEALFRPGRRRILVGNLPYQITGPLVERAVNTGAGLDLCVFLVQREVAERMTAAPNSASYGGLSVFCQAAFNVKRAFPVRRGAFYPQPNVDSSVVTLTPHRPPRAVETELFRGLVHAAFRARRKVLRNAWKGLFAVPEDVLRQAAAKVGVSLDARGETLGVEDFGRLSEEFQALGVVATAKGDG